MLLRVVTYILVLVVVQGRNVLVEVQDNSPRLPSGHQHDAFWSQGYPMVQGVPYVNDVDFGLESYEINVDHPKYIPTIEGRPIYIPPVFKLDSKDDHPMKLYSKSTRPWHYYEDIPMRNYGHADAREKQETMHQKTKTKVPPLGTSNYPKVPAIPEVGKYITPETNKEHSLDGFKSKHPSGSQKHSEYPRTGAGSLDDTGELVSISNGIVQDIGKHSAIKEEPLTDASGEISDQEENDSLSFSHQNSANKSDKGKKNITKSDNVIKQSYYVKGSEGEGPANEQGEIDYGSESDVIDIDPRKLRETEMKGYRGGSKRPSISKKPHKPNNKHKSESSKSNNTSPEYPMKDLKTKNTSNSSKKENKPGKYETYQSEYGNVKKPNKSTYGDAPSKIENKYGGNSQNQLRKPEEETSEDIFAEESEVIQKNAHCDDCLDDTEDIEDKETDLDQEAAKDEFLKTIDTKFRSLVFNPTAQSHEKFQSCLTPTNESGSCRYVQHCLLPNILGAIDQFMNYVCIIQDRYIGVCCPEFPVTTIHAKWDGVEVDHSANSTTGNSTEYSKGCGFSSKTRIVGGQKADPKEYPWMAALLTMSTGRFFCGGALISDRYVLTAAHCTYNVPRNQILVRLGEYDFSANKSLGEDYPVVEIKRHGQYSRRTLRNDIALLKLARPAKFSSPIGTICLPLNNTYDGVNATLAGWGNVKGGGPSSDVLMEATFPVLDNTKCAETHGLPVPETSICTMATPRDKGACNGDSGGPLMVLDEGSKHWYVIGVVSWGRRGCDPKFPTVYARVTAYLDWINMHAV